MKTRIANVAHVLVEGYKKCAGYDNICIVVGNNETIEKGRNGITIVPVRGGAMCEDNITQIETNMQDINEIAELALQCLIESMVDCGNFSFANMDGSQYEIERPQNEMVIRCKVLK